MSLSRKNWTALSSLAQQRTLEDEEEIFREQRRRNRTQSSSSSTNSDLPPSLPTEIEQPDSGGQLTRGQRSRGKRSEVERPVLERIQNIEEPEPQEALGPDDDESKFLEILRSRESRRQKRHVEILENLKQEHQNGRDQEGEPRTAQPPQQSDCATECNKERGEAKPSTEELPQQPDNAMKCGKDRGETPPSKGMTIKEAIVVPISETSGEEPRSPKQTCLQITIVGLTKQEGEASQTNTSVPTSLAGPDRSVSPISTSSAGLTSISGETNSHDGTHSNDESNQHDGPSSHDRMKGSNGPSNLDGPTSLNRRTTLPSSTSISVPTRPERRFGSKKYGTTSPAKTSNPSGSTTSATSTIKPKIPTQSTTATGSVSPDGLTSPTTISISPSQTYKSQVFVSSIKLARNKSFDDTEGKQVRRLSTQRSVEKITESRTEVDGAKSPTEETPVKEKDNTVCRNKVGQSLQLQVSLSGEEKKAAGRSDVKPPISSPEAPAGSTVTSPGPTASGTGLRRLGPRTTSVRIIPRTEQTESSFTRSASLRIPSRNFKLDAKLERYAEALQKSESVKSPTLTTKEFFATPEGVASKRSLFEREAGGSGASTPTARKSNASLTGAVSTRINQWINKTQGGASGTSGAKDVKKVDIASKRSLWEQRSLSTDTKF